MKKKAIITIIFLVLGVFVVGACSGSPASTPVVVVLAVSPTPVPIVSTPTITLTPSPTYTPTPSSTPAGWVTVDEGVQIRDMRTLSGDPVYALRLDPSRVDIELRHDGDRPQHVAEWFDGEQPIAAMNAGFFARDFSPAGLWVINGQTLGSGNRVMQGEFRVTAAGITIQRVSQRWISDGTRVIASVESYPFLIRQDGFPTRGLNGRQRAERLVVGIDGAGYVLFVLFPRNTISLRELASYLRSSDLNLHVALNLDGGSSAGMLVRAGGTVWGSDSGRDVPGVFVILPKVLGVQGNGG